MGNVRGEVRVNFLPLFASKPHIFMCGVLKLSGIVRLNVRLNIAIAMLFWSLIFASRVAIQWPILPVEQRSSILLLPWRGCAARRVART